MPYPSVNEVEPVVTLTVGVAFFVFALSLVAGVVTVQGINGELSYGLLPLSVVFMTMGAWRMREMQHASQTP